MSRTTRRNKKYLINAYLGTKSEFCDDPWTQAYAAQQGLTVLQHYQQRKARYTRDHRTGRFGVPRWYRHEHGAHAMRRLEKHRLHRALVTDSLDNHLPDQRMRNSAFYWWY